ncbi:MAG TPA: 6-carboxytetrahydropterin synthase [Terracidiphilus sp.]|jgi:6-pyruvoyltetrahydropterin/6-carboxytetrahydropterin synthase
MSATSQRAAISSQAFFGRRYNLSASHRLHSDALSAEENQAAYGKCNNPHGHGHNYVVEVLVGGKVDPDTGMVLNMVALDEAVRSRVAARFDHTNLNLDPLFVNRVPTTENLCRTVFELLDGTLEPAKLVQVRVEETENNFFEYSGNQLDAGPARNVT